MKYSSPFWRALGLFFVTMTLSLPISALSQNRTPVLPPLVDLDARDTTAGAEIWKNRASFGDFQRIGKPSLITIGGVKAVAFDGKQDAYRGAASVSALEGHSPRSIEVWAYNSSLDADEETIISWGKRGGPEASVLALGWGRSPAYGAITHWAADMGWNGTPTLKRWHYLVYTYDGKTARVYDNGVEKNKREVLLQTTSGFPLLIAMQTRADGQVQFINEYTGHQQAGSFALASLRIHAVSLSPEQIRKVFDAESPRFGATRLEVEGVMGKGKDRFLAGAFNLTLLRATQTAASLSPRGSDFDFLPSDRLMGRGFPGFYHLGDCTLRTRTAGASWKSFSSASRQEGIMPQKVAGSLSACDITQKMGIACPLTIVRIWRKEGEALVLRFQLTNRTAKPVEIGAFGAAMVFNNLLTGRSLEETHDRCSFADPAINAGAGYLQVTRLNGQGPVLLVTPEKGTSFEAYRPLYEDPTPRDVTFEGFYEWMTHTKAYADNEWSRTEAWNRATSRLLKPKESMTYGFRFVLASSVRQIEPTLIAQGRPVVVGVPGYVLPTDQTAHLFVRAPRPLASLQVEPTGALTVNPIFRATKNGWLDYTLKGNLEGRCRLTLRYTDGLEQTIHYFVTSPEQEQVRRLGAFHATKQWFADPNDPFHRTYSFLPYNRDTGERVLQHSHTWFAGLSDEIGAGASVAMAMKNLGQPQADEIALLEQYVDKTLYGRVQNKDFSVRASLFYYEPKLYPGYYTVQGGWDKARTETTWRSFNYPHVAAVYWALYRLARQQTGLVRLHPWDWYLEHAYQTVMAIRTFAPGYAEVGLMVGSVFPEILRDLKREGWSQKAKTLEAYMRERAKRWAGMRYPFGSEMPWDSTGQEEIYTWCRYFGLNDKAQVTLSAILSYMPTVPNWAYNGAGRRYFDAPVNGTRWQHIVRMTNHYGSGINSIPLMDAYRRNPTDLYLLRVGYAGLDQLMANIDSDGFASYGFDCDPAILRFDPYTADYGIAFYGYARNAGAYVMKHPEFGWLAFGGEMREDEMGLHVLPRDGFRRRVYLAPCGLWLTLEAGTFQKVSYDTKKGVVQIILDAATSATPKASLRVEEFLPTRHFSVGARVLSPLGTYTIPLSAKPTVVTLKPQ